MEEKNLHYAERNGWAGVPSRRGFLKLVSAASVLAWCGRAAGQPDPSRVMATSGDPKEPAWKERLTITVGPEKADLVGADQRALQAAVDYMAGFGGGTVKILPGTYRLRNAVYLRPNIRIVGSGDDSILVKEPSVTTELGSVANWFDQEITVAKAEGFRVGDGICLRSGGSAAKRTILARDGNRFKLSQGVGQGFSGEKPVTVSSLFALLDGQGVSDVTIENLALDGNGSNNEFLNGNHVGCIFLKDSKNIVIRNVTARNFNGDGISWQVVHDLLIEQCRALGHAGKALHPGSGSQRTIVRGNVMQNSRIGLFFCYGVRFGLAENNTIEDSGDFGVSIGHSDTDNIVRKNTIRRSGKVGILLREETNKGFAPHRNRLEANRIEQFGGNDGIGIDLQGFNEGVEVLGNEIVETRGPAERIGIRISPEVKALKLADNKIEGVAKAVVDQRSGG